MKYTCWFLLALTLLFPGGPARAGESLRIATEGAYPPFNDVDTNGNAIGFDVDIAQALCASMDVSCTVHIVKWDGLLPGLTAGEFDVIVASMAKTPEREKVVSFTNYYYRSRSTFAGDPNRKFLQTPEGLAGMALAAQADTVQANYLTTNYGGSSKIVLIKQTKWLLNCSSEDRWTPCSRTV